MTLREQIADDVTAVFLNVDDFAEVVSFVPGNGVARDVTVVIDARRDFRETETGLAQVEVLEVLCARDASNETTGGIDSPQIGDAIRRSATYDSDQRLFAFTGVATDVSDSSWRLEFARDVMFRHGGVKG